MSTYQAKASLMKKRVSTSNAFVDGLRWHSSVIALTQGLGGRGILKIVRKIIARRLVLVAVLCYDCNRSLLEIIAKNCKNMELDLIRREI